MEVTIVVWHWNIYFRIYFMNRTNTYRPTNSVCDALFEIGVAWWSPVFQLISNTSDQPSIKEKLAVWMNKWFVSVGQNKKDKLQRDTF